MAAKKKTDSLIPEPEKLRSLLEGRMIDPHSVLGMHTAPGGNVIVRVFDPMAESVKVCGENSRTTAVLKKIHPDGLFAAEFPVRKFFRYEVEKRFPNGDAVRAHHLIDLVVFAGVEEIDVHLADGGEEGIGISR